MEFEILLHKGKRQNTKSENLDEIIDYLKKRKMYMHNLFVDDIIEFLDSVGSYWKNNLSKKYGSSLNHIIDSFKSENLENIL